MERWMRALAEVRPGLVAVGAAALSVLLVLAAFAASVAAGGTRGASLAAAAALLVLIAVGASLYAWRLGVPGRSE